MSYEIENAYYRATVTDDGVIDVWRKEKRSVRTRRMLPSGEWEAVVADQMAIDLAAALDRHPMCRMAFAGDGFYHVDLDCGFQRWIGQQPAKEVRKALKTWEFPPTPILTRDRPIDC